MSYHIVTIDSPQCSLSCKDGQLTCRSADGERKLPLEDVASIIITSFSASIHSHLFLEAAKHGVALIICEAFKPVSLVLPANRSTDTLLSRALLTLPEKSRQQLWQKTIDAKCENQCSLAAHIAPADPRLPGMRQTAAGRKPHKEAVCAKTFWQIFGAAASCDEFRREPGGGNRGSSRREEAHSAGDKDQSLVTSAATPGNQPELLLTKEEVRGRLNSLLNYGYAVLLSSVLQKLFGVGLDPTWGVSHAPRERSTPLAYDLMEPFRPCVDWRVFQWVRDHPDRKDWDVTKEFRQWVTRFPLERVDYLDFTLEIQGVIEGVVRGFRRAVLEDKPAFYRPWTPRNSKWAG
jgi:CRISPR-associated protein Cas1